MTSMAVGSVPSIASVLCEDDSSFLSDMARLFGRNQSQALLESLMTDSSQFLDNSSQRPLCSEK